MARAAASLGAVLLLTSLRASLAQQSGASCVDVAGIYGTNWIEQDGCDITLPGLGARTYGVVFGSSINGTYIDWDGAVRLHHGTVMADSSIMWTGGYHWSRTHCAEVAGLYTKDHDNVTWIAVGQTACALTVRTPWGTLSGSISERDVTLSGVENGTEVQWNGTARRNATGLTFVDFSGSVLGTWVQSGVVPCFDALEFAPTDACWAPLSAMLRSGSLDRVIGDTVARGRDPHDPGCSNDHKITTEAECVVRSCFWTQSWFDASGEGCTCQKDACIDKQLGWANRVSGELCYDDHGDGHGILRAALHGITGSCCPATQRSICDILGWGGGSNQQCIKVPTAAARRLNLATCVQ